MNMNSANRRQVLSAGALFGLVALLPDLSWFKAGEEQGPVTSVGKCIFPREYSAQEFLDLSARWRDAERVEALMAGFYRDGLILNEYFDLQPRSATWTIEFANRQAFERCHRQLQELFDDRELKRNGFAREFVVTAGGRSLHVQENDV